jgi:hypothetical protein
MSRSQLSSINLDPTGGSCETVLRLRRLRRNALAPARKTRYAPRQIHELGGRPSNRIVDVQYGARGRKWLSSLGDCAGSGKPRTGADGHMGSRAWSAVDCRDCAGARHRLCGTVGMAIPIKPNHRSGRRGVTTAVRARLRSLNLSGVAGVMRHLRGWGWVRIRRRRFR